MGDVDPAAVRRAGDAGGAQRQRLDTSLTCQTRDDGGLARIAQVDDGQSPISQRRDPDSRP